MHLNTLFKNYKLVSVIGSQWGDEGKGKLVSAISNHFNAVARFNGGANAGHTVYRKSKKYSFHMSPCGILNSRIKNVIGNGTVLDYNSLTKELDIIKEDGYNNESNLFISDRCHIVFDYHKIIDSLLESQSQENKIGTTMKGIGPCYSFKSARFGIRTCDLVHNFDTFVAKYDSLLEKIKALSGNKLKFTEKQRKQELQMLEVFRNRFKSNIVDTGYLLEKYLRDGRRILAEGANATMLDLNFGTYPYVTSSNTTNGGIFSGLGISPDEELFSIGVAKAYTTRVGLGPFPTEVTGPIGEWLCKKGDEFGTTTGRKRRIGWIDIPLLRYSARVNGFKAINLTKLDVLSDLDEIKIATEYMIGSETLPHGTFPASLEELASVKVKYETMIGWKGTIQNIDYPKKLPGNAKCYIQQIENLLGIPVQWVGVGPLRSQIIAK